MLMQRLNARLLSLAGATALMLGAASGIHATAQTAALPVTATISPQCTISTAAVAFGAYDPIVTNVSAALTQTGTVSVTCTTGASTTVTLGQGSNANGGSSAAVPLRRMKAGTADFLSYELYSDSGRSTVWADTAPTGKAHTGVGTQTDLTVYGSVPGGQNAATGNYTDSVVATVTF